MNIYSKKMAGFSLIETLVVMTIFTLLATVATQSVMLALRGARKVDNSSEVRENLDFAMSIIERQLKNATEIDSNCDWGGSGSSGNMSGIDYYDQDEFLTSFSCLDSDGDSLNDYIASGSAAITNSSVTLTNCSFRCYDSTSATPKYVEVVLAGERTGVPSIDQASVELSTTINLRVY